MIKLINILSVDIKKLVHYFQCSTGLLSHQLIELITLINILSLEIFLTLVFSKVDDRDDESYGDFSGDLPQC